MARAAIQFTISSITSSRGDETIASTRLQVESKAAPEMPPIIFNSDNVAGNCASVVLRRSRTSTGAVR